MFWRWWLKPLEVASTNCRKARGLKRPFKRLDCLGPWCAWEGNSFTTWLEETNTSCAFFCIRDLNKQTKPCKLQFYRDTLPCQRGRKQRCTPSCPSLHVQLGPSAHVLFESQASAREVPPCAGGAGRSLSCPTPGQRSQHGCQTSRQDEKAGCEIVGSMTV